MKEYICKEDLLNDIYEGKFYPTWNAELAKAMVEKQGAVTKADICRDFAEKLKRMFEDSVWNDPYKHCVLPLLEEMEKKE